MAQILSLVKAGYISHQLGKKAFKASGIFISIDSRSVSDIHLPDCPRALPQCFNQAFQAALHRFQQVHRPWNDFHVHGLPHLSAQRQ